MVTRQIVKKRMNGGCIMINKETMGVAKQNNIKIEKPRDVQKKPVLERPEAKQFCQACGKELDFGINFCPICGRPKVLPPVQYPYQQPYLPPPGQPPYYYQRTGKSLTGAILIILGAMFCLVEGTIIYSTGVYSRWGWWYNPIWSYWGWVVMILIVFAYWGFAIGLTGGILTLKRIKFPLAIIGSAFVIVSGCLAFLGTFFFGILILVLGILGTIFIAISKDEFR